MLRTILVWLALAGLQICPLECRSAPESCCGPAPCAERAPACCAECAYPHEAACAEPVTLPHRLPQPAPVSNKAPCVCQGALVACSAERCLELTQCIALDVGHAATLVGPVLPAVSPSSTNVNFLPHIVSGAELRRTLCALTI